MIDYETISVIHSCRENANESSAYFNSHEAGCTNAAIGRRRGVYQDSVKLYAQDMMKVIFITHCVQCIRHRVL
jgi:hypothetical protein